MKATFKFAVLAMCASLMLVGCGGSGADWADDEVPEAGAPGAGGSSNPAQPSDPSGSSDPAGSGDSSNPSESDDDDFYEQDESLDVPGSIEQTRGTVTASPDAEPSPEGQGLLQASIAVTPEDSPAMGSFLKAKIADTDTHYVAIVCGEDGDCDYHSSDMKKVVGDAAGTRTGVDILFVLDTTSSMGSGLRSVRDGIQGFVSDLATRGLDARVGAVTFGDAYDTTTINTKTGVSIGDKNPPDFDTNPRASFKLTDKREDFLSFMQSDDVYARADGGKGGSGGGDAPENALGATAFGYEHFNWKPGAQRIAIVVTDNCSHTYDSFDTSSRRMDDFWKDWRPPVLNDFRGQIRGRMTVHAVMPDEAGTDEAECINRSERYMRMDELTGPTATGGRYIEWDNKDEFSLEELDIKKGVTDYVLTFRPRGEKGYVRLVVWTPSEGLLGSGATYNGEGCWDSAFAPDDFAVCDETRIDYDMTSQDAAD